MGQWPPVGGDCMFESYQGHGCLSVVNVVCCQVEVTAMVCTIVQRSPTDHVCAFSMIKCNNYFLCRGRLGKKERKICFPKGQSLFIFVFIHLPLDLYRYGDSHNNT